MKLFAVLLGALALVAGFTGGLRAYSASAQAGPPVPAAHGGRSTTTRRRRSSARTGAEVGAVREAAPSGSDAPASPT